MVALALPAVLTLVVLVGMILVVPDGALVDCERDGHFQRAGWLSCGVGYPNAPYGPLLPWLVAPLIPVVGTPYLAGRILSLLALLGLVGLSWRAARVYGAGLGAAALTALLVGLNGPMLFYGSMACSDMPATSLFLGASWLALRGLDARGAPWRLGLAGLLLAAACLVRVQFYLPALVMLAVTPLLARRLRPGLALLLGFGLPVVLALAVGWRRYGDPGDALSLHLGLAAYTRNLVRAGAILGQVGVEGDAVSLGGRLAWSVQLVVRSTGGLPLLGALGALVLSLSRRRWRPLLVVLVPALALYAGLAWSHPPPDWGARRFYLFLVPVCAVATVLLGRVALQRWRPGSRALPVCLALALGLAAAAHGVWEIRSFRAPELGSLAHSSGDVPRGLASSYERGVIREVGRLGADLDACAPVATNFHAATTCFRNAWFLGDVPLEGPWTWAEDIPRGPAGELWLLWVPPGGEGSPVLVPAPRSGAASPALGSPP